MKPISISLPELNTTEEEVLANIAGLNFDAKLINRATNLVRQKFRMWRAMVLLDESISNQKKSERNG